MGFRSHQALRDFDNCERWCQQCKTSIHLAHLGTATGSADFPVDFPVRSNPRPSYGSNKRPEASCRSTLLRTGKSALRRTCLKKYSSIAKNIDTTRTLPHINGDYLLSCGRRPHIFPDAD